MDYVLLRPLVAAVDAAAPGLSEQDAADRLNTPSITEVLSRFGSFRTLAAVLSPEEYAVLRAVLDAAAAQNVLVSDMVRMLELPGDDAGNGGGVDFGSPAVRAMLPALGVPAEIAAKVVAIAERLVSPAEAAGLGSVLDTDVAIARGTRLAVQQEPEHG